MVAVRLLTVVVVIRYTNLFFYFLLFNWKTKLVCLSIVHQVPLYCISSSSSNNAHTVVLLLIIILLVLVVVVVPVVVPLHN